MIEEGTTVIYRSVKYDVGVGMSTVVYVYVLTLATFVSYGFSQNVSLFFYIVLR